MGPLPVGYRFHPTEQELVGYFLKNKVMGQPLMGWESELIVERDLYGDGATPWELLRDDNGDLPWQIVVESSAKVVQSQKVIYVFTKLSTVGKKGKKKHKNRVAGCGSWHGNTSMEDVRDNYGEGKVIGSKRTFTFSSQEETVGHWTMYEYSIDAAANGLCPGMNCENYVLCKIKKDESKISKGGRIVSRKRANSKLNEVEWGEVDEKSLGKKRILDRSAEASGLTMNEGASTSCQETALTTEETSRNIADESGVTGAGTTSPVNMASGPSNDIGLGEDGGGPYIVDMDAIPVFHFVEEDLSNPNMWFDFVEEDFLGEEG